MKILAIRLSSMGDVIHTLPAVASLKRTFPQAEISWIVKPQWATLLQGNPSVDHIIPFERTRTGIASAWSSLRKSAFDLAIDFQGLIQSALIASATRATTIIGFDKSQAREPLACLAYSKPTHTTGPHRVDDYLQLTGTPAAPAEFPLPGGHPESQLPTGDFILACPLAGWASKQWPLEYYSELAKHVPLVVNGPPSSESTLRQIANAHVHLSGIPGLIDATRRARAIIGVDSGPMHLAAALAKPGVAIFGPTDPVTHGPYGGSLKVLRSPNAITSYQRREEIDPSMRAITPRKVLAAL